MWVGLISYPFFIIQFEFKLARIIKGVANLNSCITNIVKNKYKKHLVISNILFIFDETKNDKQ